MVVHICTQPYLVDPISYDSRKETGFVGLQNQGATCYMVSTYFWKMLKISENIFSLFLELTFTNVVPFNLFQKSCLQDAYR